MELGPRGEGQGGGGAREGEGEGGGDGVEGGEERLLPGEGVGGVGHHQQRGGAPHLGEGVK